ncbi:MAG: TetR/AcrR family transcriptional regulator [Frankia sp.]|nr:TetR/AcrR family transcriptional regulator [Frankia sp.]
MSPTPAATSPGTSQDDAARPGADQPAGRLRCDAARNRERVLTAAMELYRERGSAFTMEEVASRAGVGIGTVYRRFPTRQALLDELARPYFEQLLSTARAARAHPVPAERLEVLVRTMAERHAASGLRSGRMWDRTVARPLRDEYLRTVDLILADARAGGRVRPEIDLRDIGVLIWTLSALVEATDREAPVIWRRHLDIMLEGLRPDGHRPPATRPIEAADWDRMAATGPVLQLR